MTHQRQNAASSIPLLAVASLHGVADQLDHGVDMFAQSKEMNPTAIGDVPVMLCNVAHVAGVTQPECIP